MISLKCPTFHNCRPAPYKIDWQVWVVEMAISAGGSNFSWLWFSLFCWFLDWNSRFDICLQNNCHSAVILNVEPSTQQSNLKGFCWKTFSIFFYFVHWTIFRSAATSYPLVYPIPWCWNQYLGRRILLVFIKKMSVALVDSVFLITLRSLSWYLQFLYNLRFARFPLLIYNEHKYLDTTERIWFKSSKEDPDGVGQAHPFPE